MNRHERIALAIRHSKKLKKTIAAECGVTSSAVTQWVTGDSKSMRPENLFALAAATGVSAEWLANGTGDMLESTGKGADDSGSPNEKDYALIPQYSAKGSCGEGYFNEHVQTTEGLVFKRDWLRRMGAKPENLFVIYADGDSMEPYIFEGDVVLFDVSQVEPKDKQVYVIRRPDGGNSIKRLNHQLSGAWVIRSDNPDKVNYPDEPVSDAAMHDMPFIGRVIWRGGSIG
ncbi:helix-turn-helix domain-containing protein [Pseudomonas sp. GD03860]|uniref:LexA family transcriptional regulator n=1 Tax=Pseudomonas sp. GD03860 TaxID=2975389 RepID=UPI002446C9CF|nr:S24 family peptidase [Pseudomonas sp. GD03860]MDH0640645.1 helix-turn-helix domain-containing protein [Pseudomonas sp. GD03860]